MVNPLKIWVQKVMPAVFDDSISLYESLGKCVDKINELVKSTNNWQEIIDGFIAWATGTFETKKSLTENRLLSPTGNFTGTIFGLPGYVMGVNKDKIFYLTQQFQDGQTGLVIDGGFFTDSGINKSYNGGYF